MLTKSGLEFVLHITNYFHGHYEDPGWGQRPASQILAALSIYESANNIEDTELRRQLQTVAEKAIADNAQKFVKAK